MSFNSTTVARALKRKITSAAVSTTRMSATTDTTKECGGRMTNQHSHAMPARVRPGWRLNRVIL
jgi:hypothetical protein